MRMLDISDLTGVGVAGPVRDHPPVRSQLLPDPAGAGPVPVTPRPHRLPARPLRPHQCPG